MITTSSSLSRRMPRRFLIISNRKRWRVDPSKKTQQYGDGSQRQFSNKTEDVTFLGSKVFGVGTLAGICGSLAGMGGGFVMIPLMTSNLIRLSQHQAHGTSLFAVTTTGIAGALGYSGEVNIEAAALIACSGMITARLGASVTSRLSEKSLKKALGVFMLFVAPIVPAKAYFVRKGETYGAQDPSNLPQTGGSRSPQTRYAPALIGLGSGFLAGLFGVGGGAIVVPALTLATDMTHYQALGTSLCAMVLPATVGTATHYMKGNVSMRVAPGLALGAFLGGFMGGKLGTQTNENALRWGFSGVMVTLGARTLIK